MTATPTVRCCPTVASHAVHTRAVDVRPTALPRRKDWSALTAGLFSATHKICSFKSGGPPLPDVPGGQCASSSTCIGCSDKALPSPALAGQSLKLARAEDRTIIQSNLQQQQQQQHDAVGKKGRRGNNASGGLGSMGAPSHTHGTAGSHSALSCSAHPRAVAIEPGPT